MDGQEFLSKGRDGGRRFGGCEILSENRKNGEFESVPRAGHAKTRPLPYAIREPRIARQKRSDMRCIRAQVEQAAGSLNGLHQVSASRKKYAHAQARLRGLMPHLDRSRLAADFYRPAIDFAFHRFHAGNRTIP